jgi:hypothetical protein
VAPEKLQALQAAMPVLDEAIIASLSQG